MELVPRTSNIPSIITPGLDIIRTPTPSPREPSGPTTNILPDITSGLTTVLENIHSATTVSPGSATITNVETTIKTIINNLEGVLGNTVSTPSGSQPPVTQKPSGPQKPSPQPPSGPQPSGIPIGDIDDVIIQIDLDKNKFVHYPVTTSPGVSSATGAYLPTISSQTTTVKQPVVAPPASTPVVAPLTSTQVVPIATSITNALGVVLQNVTKP